MKLLCFLSRYACSPSVAVVGVVVATGSCNAQACIALDTFDIDSSLVPHHQVVTPSPRKNSGGMEAFCKTLDTCADPPQLNCAHSFNRVCLRFSQHEKP